MGEKTTCPQQSSSPLEPSPESREEEGTGHAVQVNTLFAAPSSISLSQSAPPTSPENVVISISQSVGDGTTEFSQEQNAGGYYTQAKGSCDSANADANESGAPPTYTRKRAKRWGYKNVCGVSISMVMVFTSFIGLQSLQSSINSTGGLGLASLSTLYLCFIISGFVSPSVLKLVGTKYSLLIGFLCHLQYTIFSYYPSWYTLIPSSVIVGFASGPLWAAASGHLFEVAATIAPVLNEDLSYLIGKFSGLFFFIFHWSQIPGNLASSLILFPYNDWISESDNASNEHDCSFESDINMDRLYLYILASVYVIFIVAGISVLLIFVDNLATQRHSRAPSGIRKKLAIYLKQPLVEVGSILGSVKMILLAPLSFLNGIELSFVFGTFTEV